MLADPDPKVKLRAAQGLLVVKKTTGVPVLIDLLESLDTTIGWQAEELLRWLAGPGSPGKTLLGEGTVKRNCQREWRTWWAKNCEKRDLVRSIPPDRKPGLLLMRASYGDKDRVSLIGSDGTSRWHLTFDARTSSPQFLPSGRVLLVRERQLSTSGESKGPQPLVETNFQGEITWSSNIFPTPTTCRRLPNGDTLVADLFVGVGLVWVHGQKRLLKRKANCTDPVILANGEVVYREEFQQKITRFIGFDPFSGEQIYEFAPRKPVSSNAGIQVLRNGHFMICTPLDKYVLELDKKGAIQKEYTKIANSAIRLRDGATILSLFTENGCALERIQGSGKVTWKVTLDGQGTDIEECLRLVRFGF